MIWLACDIFFWIIQKRKSFRRYYAGGVALFLSLFVLSIGWYSDHHVAQTDYLLETTKIGQDLKIIGFADAHIGTTFNAAGFEKHLAAMQAQKPDIVLVAGDFVDDDTSKEEMIAACKALGRLRTTDGVYFVFGNHDKGYYGPAHRGFSEKDLIQELRKNGVKVLRDEVVAVDETLYIIGRRDFSEGHRRKSMKELTENLDKLKYMLVIDHQPTDYAQQTQAAVDLVFSGHTHGGQLFPFNQVGKWIGANDRVYGHEKRNKTDFIVTSGLSDWAIKFKTGTKSEYVVIHLKKSVIPLSFPDSVY